VLSVERRYSASLAVSDAAIYSASALNKAINVWRFDLQLIGAPCSRNMWPLVDFRSVMLPAQSELV
jgi:hypothetical protein